MAIPARLPVRAYGFIPSQPRASDSLPYLWMEMTLETVIYSELGSVTVSVRLNMYLQMKIDMFILAAYV